MLELAHDIFDPILEELLFQMGFLHKIVKLDKTFIVSLDHVMRGNKGGVAKIKVDIRVVAATNQNLQAAIAKQKFREDLYYRLSVFPVTIPPLRERKEDIPALIEHFMNYYCQELKKPVKTVNPAAMELLVNHSWGGNVRELQNAIERAIILSEGQVITPDQLMLRTREVGRTEGPSAEQRIDGTLQEVSSAAARMAEEKLIRKVLKETGGNKSRAAEILQVSYKTLLTKIKDYQIDR